MVEKDPSAVALGKKGGAKGGRARAKSLSKEERVEIAKKAANARWNVPKATHLGELHVGGLTLPCAVLEDGTRVISQRGFYKSLGGTHLSGRRKEADADLPSFLGVKSLEPFISEELRATLKKPIKYRTLAPEGKEGWAGQAFGIDATLIPQVCEIYLKARDAGKLHYRQQKIASNADLIMRGLARVGIVALVDEATGYQYERARRALATILEEFVAKELAQWAHTFPEEFYKELYRLHPKLSPEMLGNQKPQWIGNVTNDVIYERLAPGLREELGKKNPRRSSGYRGVKHHQWLTRQSGYPKLMFHLGRVLTLMVESTGWDDFKKKLDRQLPKFGGTRLLDQGAQTPGHLETSALKPHPSAPTGGTGRGPRGTSSTR